MLGAALLVACATAVPPEPAEPAKAPDPFADARDRLVDLTMAKPIDERTPITDERVLQAMRTVERHRFVPKHLETRAYEDNPLPIGHDQTISQPYIVALMTELARPEPGDTFLEIGTGSGYQAAVLAQIVQTVYTIEIVEPLAKAAEADLKEAGVTNVVVRAGDGYKGWPEHAPFDGILVTAAPDHVPQPLLDQLAPGARMVIPVGPQGDVQHLTVIERKADGTLKTEKIDPVIFVPLTGDHGR